MFTRLTTLGGRASSGCSLFPSALCVNGLSTLENHMQKLICFNTRIISSQASFCCCWSRYVFKLWSYGIGFSFTSSIKKSSVKSEKAPTLLLIGHGKSRRPTTHDTGPANCKNARTRMGVASPDASDSDHSCKNDHVGLQGQWPESEKENCAAHWLRCNSRIGPSNIYTPAGSKHCAQYAQCDDSRKQPIAFFSAFTLPIHTNDA